MGGGDDVTSCGRNPISASHKRYLLDKHEVGRHVGSDVASRLHGYLD